MFHKLKIFYHDRENQKKYATWLFSYTKPYLRSLSLMLAFQITASLLSLGMSLISKTIIDCATSGKTISYAILLFIVLLILSQAITILTSLISIVISEKFSFGIRKNVYEKILRSDWLSVSKYHTGDLMTRLTSDTDAVATGISGTIPSILLLIVQLGSSFITLYIFEPFLAISSLILAPIAFFSSTILGQKLKRLQVKVQESEAQYRSFIQESLSNLMVIKSFCNENYAVSRLNTLRTERLHWILKKNRMSLATSSTINVGFQFAYILAFTWGALGIANGRITYGTMSLFLSLVGQVQAPLISLAQTIPRIISILASAGRIMEIQNLPSEKYAKQTIETTSIGAKLEHISFGYHSHLVLDNASLEIKPGETIAIVGESGIGKTTLIRLILCLLNSSSGQISFYNDQGQMEAANAGSRSFISYVPQGNTLFSGTIAENIRMGKYDATESELISVLKASNAYAFVEQLPNGIYTEIGEKGHGISEGQAQRIAIARALIRNAPFLILDEATASLDAQTELQVLNGIRSLHPKPTCILITHRLSVLKYCDRELRIEDKKIKAGSL